MIQKKRKVKKIIYGIPGTIIPMLSAIMLFQCQSDRSSEIDLAYTPDKVEIFADEFISTNLYERDIAISPKGDEIIYTLGDYKQSKQCLVRIRKIGSAWGRKEILGFSGQYSDLEPCFSANGNELYFASDRPTDVNSEKGDFNIWVSARINEDWSEPKP